VGFGLRMRGMPRAAIAARVEAMLALVRLPGFGSRRPAELSGGQAQRVALARALVTQPRVLLLDEPLANLDAQLRDEMRQLIADVQRETGVTTLMVTHDREEATVMADRIALLLGGRLRQEGTPEDLWHRPADAAVAAFFGARNLFAGQVKAGVFHGPFGPVALPPATRLPDGPAMLTFRPEALRRLDEGLAGGPGAVLHGRVAKAQFLGARVRVVLDVGPARIEADLPPGEAWVRGAAATLHLPPGAAWVMPG
jgi:ABC-type Fe3+/spermidine/putrescine transport system ATPase subunit